MESEECSIKSHYISNAKNYCYKGKYLKTNSIGEVLRNICINLNIIPDTENGYTKNCRFYIVNHDNEFLLKNISIEDIKKKLNLSEWKYDPYDDIFNVIKDYNDDKEKIIQIIIERIE